QHRFAVVKRRERHFHVCGWRSDDTDKINIGSRNDLTPVVGYVFYSKLVGNVSCALAMLAGNSNHPCTHAVTESGDLGRTGKPSSDDSNSDRFSVSQSNPPSVA